MPHTQGDYNLFKSLKPIFYVLVPYTRSHIFDSGQETEMVKIKPEFRL